MLAVSLLLLLICSISAKAFAWSNWVYQTNCAAGIAEREVLDKKIVFDDFSQQLQASINQRLTGDAGTIHWLQSSIKTNSAKKPGTYIVQTLLTIELLESKLPYCILFINNLKIQRSSPLLIAAKQKTISTIAHLFENTKGHVLFSKNDLHPTKEY